MGGREPYRIRLSVDITREQRDKLNQFLPWGTQNTFFSCIIDDITKTFSEHPNPQMLVAMVLDRKLKLNDLSKTISGSS